MSKFKVGDRVRRIGHSVGEHILLWNVYTVGSVSSSGDITVTETKGWWDSELFILAPKTTPHKHAELIKAWADGATIECDWGVGWRDAGDDPSWTLGYKYRIKPEPKPDYVVSAYGYDRSVLDQVVLTFDGETGKLKAVKLKDS